MAYDELNYIDVELKKGYNYVLLVFFLSIRSILN